MKSIFGKKGVAGKTSDRRRLNMILMPARSGKSGLVEKMQKFIANVDGKPVFFYDVDAIAQSLISVHNLQAFEKPSTMLLLEEKLFPLIHDEIKGQLDSAADVTVVLVTSNLRFPKYKDIAIKEKRMMVFVPCRELYNTIYDQLDKLDKNHEVAEIFARSRDELLTTYAKSEDKKGEKGYMTYATLDDIVKQVADQLKMSLSAV